MQRIGKRCAFFGLAFALLLPACWPQPASANITITIYIGKPPSCQGWGFCKISIGWGATAAPEPKGDDSARRAERRKCRASASIKDNKMFIEMETALGERAASVPIDQDLALDAATARGVGFKSVIVKKGDYKIDYSKNKLGSLVLNVETRN